MRQRVGALKRELGRIGRLGGESVTVTAKKEAHRKGELYDSDLRLTVAARRGFCAKMAHLNSLGKAP